MVIFRAVIFGSFGPTRTFPFRVSILPRLLSSLLLMGFSFSFFSGCDWQWGKLSQKTVVQVNDDTLTTREFAERLAENLRELDAISVKNPSQIKQVKDRVVHDFIMESLVQDYGKLAKIQITESELEKEVNDTRAEYPDDLSFRRTLAREGLSFVEWKARLQKSMVDRKIFKSMGEKIPSPSTDELKKYYSEHKDKFTRPERIYLRQIVVDDLTKAKTLIEKNKKSDFSKLAEKYSVAPEARNGGLVGWVEKGSVEIFDKAFSLSVNGVSPILESPYGFHIFKVEKKAAAGVAPFDEVRDTIKRILVSEKDQRDFIAWLDQRIRASRISINEDLIQAVSVETKGVK